LGGIEGGEGGKGHLICGPQSQVERMQHCTHGLDAVEAGHVPVVVPHACGHAIVALDAPLMQSMPGQT
jgi:hypothetical protein